MFHPATILILLLMALVFANLPVEPRWRNIVSVIALFFGTLYLIVSTGALGLG